MTLPLLVLSDGAAVLADALAWAVTGTLTGYVTHRLPARWLSTDALVPPISRMESGGRIYQRLLWVHRWKDALPEAGALFRGGFSKRKLVSRSQEHLARFLVETRRAELTHYGAMAFAPLFFLWNRPLLAWCMVLYALAANVPFIVIQRYNRARLERVLGARCVDPRPRQSGAPVVSWYALGMTRKIAISLPDRTLRKVRAVVKSGRAPSVSNYIAQLVEDASAEETFNEMIADWIRRSGASDAEVRAAREESRRAFERAGLVPKGGRRERAARKAG